MKCNVATNVKDCGENSNSDSYKKSNLNDFIVDSCVTKHISNSWVHFNILHVTETGAINCANKNTDANL